MAKPRGPGKAKRRNPVKKVLRLVPRAIRKAVHWSNQNKQRVAWDAMHEARAQHAALRGALNLADAEAERLEGGVMGMPAGKARDKKVLELKGFLDRIKESRRLVGSLEEREDRTRLEWRRQRAAGLPGMMRRLAVGTRLRTGRRMVDYAEARKTRGDFDALLGLALRPRRRKR